MTLSQSSQWRQSGLKSGGLWIGSKKFRFFQANFREISIFSGNFTKISIFQANIWKISIFPGTFSKNFDFPGKNCSFIATSGQIILFSSLFELRATLLLLHRSVVAISAQLSLLIQNGNRPFSSVIFSIVDYSRLLYPFLSEVRPI